MGRGSAPEIWEGAGLLYGDAIPRPRDTDIEHVFDLIRRRIDGGTEVFSDLSLLDAEEERAPTKEGHRRRLARNRAALRTMHARGLLEIVSGPTYECFRLTAAGSAKQESASC